MSWIYAVQQLVHQSLPLNLTARTAPCLQGISLDKCPLYSFPVIMYSIKLSHLKLFSENTITTKTNYCHTNIVCYIFQNQVRLPSTTFSNWLLPFYYLIFLIKLKATNMKLKIFYFIFISIDSIMELPFSCISPSHTFRIKINSNFTLI